MKQIRKTRPLKPSDYIRKGWCQKQFAKDSRGRRVHATSKLAISWCLLGSLEAAYSENFPRKKKALDKLYKKLRTVQYARWNDDSTRIQGDVLKVLVAIGE